ncbi:MAG: hypothetical protein V1495_05215 [Pseudomonadota bacterium]
MPRQLLSAILLLATLNFVGCRKPFQADIQDIADRDDVPPNVIIHTVFIGDNWISKKTIEKKGNFQLSNCVQANTPVPAGSATPTGSGTSAASTQKQETRVGINGYLTESFNYAKAKDGSQKRKTDVYFIPYSETSDDPPLIPGERYCFDVKDMAADGADSALVMGKSVTFQVKNRDEFGFATGEDDLQITSTNISNTKDKKTVTPEEAVLVEVSDHANPREIVQGTHLCSSSKEQTGSKDNSSSPCGNNGINIQGGRIYLLEDMTPDPDTKYITANFNLYAFDGGVTDTEHRYVLQVGVPSKGEVGRVSFTPEGTTVSTEETMTDETKTDETKADETKSSKADKAKKKQAAQSAKQGNQLKNFKQKSDFPKDVDNVLWIQIGTTT